MFTARLLCATVVFLASVPALFAETQWAVVIGISRYKTLPENQWLKYADQDARMFADHLKSPFVGVPPENVRFLLNEEATTANIKNLLGDWLPDRVGPDDMVFVYFAGHGVVDKRNDAYFITHDTDPARLYATAYEMQELKRALNRVKYKHLVLVSDACRSGSIGEDEFASRDLEVTRINDAFKGIVADNAEVSKSEFVLTAAGSSEKSFESDEWGGGHGAFTHFLVEGLKGAADRDANGRTSANEILDYVRANVNRVTGGKQNPMPASTRYDGNNLVLSRNDNSPLGGTFVAAASTPASDSPTRPPADVAGRRGSLLVSSSLSGVRILIDNEPNGVVEASGQAVIQLTAGSHILTAQKAGYKPFSAIVTIQPDRQTEQPVTLTPEAASAAPELMTKLADAQQLLLTREAEGLRALEALFSTAIMLRSGRVLLPDEENVAGDIFLMLGEQYLKRRQAAKATGLIREYLQGVPFLPETTSNKLSPELRAAIRKDVASVRLEIQPSQGLLEVDARIYGVLESTEEVFLTPGIHSVRVSRPGFNPFERQLELAAGQVADLADRLALSAITVYVFSETPGVQVIRDGRAVASVRPIVEVQTTLRSDQRDRLRRMYDRRAASSPVQVAVLSDLPADLTDLRLSFTRDKYTTQQAAIAFAGDIREGLYENGGDYIWDGTVRLEKLMGQIEITSVPSGADVLIDNKRLGTTPFKTTYEIGDFDLIVRHGVWKHQRRITIKDRETSAVEAKLQAPVVYLGIHSPQVDAQKYATLDARIREIVPKAFSNYIGEVQNASRYEYMLEFLTEAMERKTSLDPRLKILRERFASELFLVGYFPSEREYLSNTVKFLLFSSLTARPDVRDVEMSRPGEFEKFLAEIDSVKLTPTDLFRPYIGLDSLDTAIPGQELIALSVDESGPSARAGIAVGDRLLRLNGEAATSLRLAQLTENNPVGTELQLEIENAAGRKTVAVKSAPLPRLIVRVGSRALVSSLITQLEYLRFFLPPRGSHESNIVVLNQALAQIATENWARAIETLNGFDDAATNSAVLRPAVYYYRGLCFEQLGEKAQASRWYESAAQEKDTLLQSELSFDFQTLGSWRRDYLR